METAVVVEARRAYEQAAGWVAGLVARYGEAVVVGWVRSGLPAEAKGKSGRGLTMAGGR
jgi:hypothetical protein